MAPRRPRRKPEPRRQPRRDSSNQQGTATFHWRTYQSQGLRDLSKGTTNTSSEVRRSFSFVIPPVSIAFVHPRSGAALSSGRVTRDTSLLPSMINVVLVEPEIPPNTGNVARLCAANHVPLHIVGVTGFRLDDRSVRRAGLDYWPEVSLHRHTNLDSLYRYLPQARFIYLSTRADRPYSDWIFEKNDCLIFGRETRGLPEKLLRQNWERCLTIPMLNRKVRSLNLATSVGIVLYEALRQLGVFSASTKQPV